MVEVPDHFAVTLEDLGVLDFHLLFLFWLDGKDANLEQALPGILEKRGIERLANDVLVNLAGFLGIEEFGLLHLAVHLHGKLVDPRSLGHGKNESTL